MLIVQERSSVLSRRDLSPGEIFSNVHPRNLEAGTLSPHAFCLFFQKSIMSNFVFEELKRILFSEHHAVSLWTSSLWAF